MTSANNSSGVNYFRFIFAMCVQFYSSFDAECFGLKTLICGLNDKLPILFEEILKQFTIFEPKETEFESNKEHFLDTYSTYMKSPESVSTFLSKTDSKIG